jgi:hypothetical protein
MGRHRTRQVVADRARSFTTLKDWPDEALAYLQEVFERKRQGAGPTWAELLADLKTRFNVDWNDSSLSRYYGFWEQRLRLERVAHDEAIALAEHFLKDNSGDNKELLAQLLEHQRLIALSNLGAAEPSEVVALGLASDRLELAKKKLGLDEERKKLQAEKVKIDQGHLDLERRKVELREKASQVADRVEEKAKAVGKTLDPEVARMIREEVYGLPA